MRYFPNRGFALLALGAALVGCGSSPDSGPGEPEGDSPVEPSDTPNEPDAMQNAGGPSEGSGGAGSEPTSSGGSAGTAPTGTTTPPPPPAGVSECVDPNLVGPSPIRRVSTDEYTNAVRDVFQISTNPGQLPADEKLGIFKTNVTTRITEDHFERYNTVASTVAAEVATNLSALSGCADSADSACVTAYLDKTARRLFHGTLEAEDQQRLTELYTTVLASTDAETALRTAVQWMLLSPRFLFLVEFGGDTTGGQAPLSGSEIAGRLAAFLWRTVPDDALLAAADAGELDTPEGVRSHAEVMLSDERSRPTLESFGNQLLRIIPPPPGADALEVQKKAEVGKILASASSDPNLLFEGLINGENPSAGAELDSFYGDEARRGLLMTAGFLASNATGELASPVKRGYMIRAALLCGVVPPPSDPVDMQLADEVGENDKEVFNAHSSVPECWGCHQLMDPIGDAFGEYNALGAYDPGATPSTSGTITPGSDEGAFEDLNGFLELLSKDQKAKECFALQTARFALGRNETKADACGVQDILTAAEASNFSVRELVLSVATSSLFSNRNPVNPGGTCR